MQEDILGHHFGRGVTSGCRLPASASNNGGADSSVDMAALGPPAMVTFRSDTA